MDIFLSDVSRIIVLKLPIVPENMPPLSYNAQNEVFETLEGYLTLPTNFIEPYSLTFNSFFPYNEYSFSKTNVEPDIYILFIKSLMKLSAGVRIIITDNEGKEILNDIFIIDEFSYYPDKVGDIKYTLKVTKKIS